MDKLTSYLDSKGRGARTAFAAAAGITPAMLSHMESGRKGITPEMAVRLSEASGGAFTPADLRPDLAAIFAPRAAQ